jgi:hypothetical protein
MSRSLAGSRRVCPLALVLAVAPLLPSPRSPRPKSAVRLHLLPPTPAGILVPATVDGDFLGIWVCELPRSAYHFLGLSVYCCFWDPGRWLAASPCCGPCCQNPSCLTAPGSFLGRHLIAVVLHWGAVIMRLVTAMFTGGHGCRRRYGGDT